MARLTISLPDKVHSRLSALAIKNNESLSNIINQLVQVGLYHFFSEEGHSKETNAIEKYCHQLIIQMNALIKNMSVELLKLNRDDLEKLQLAATNKYRELKSSSYENHS